MKRHLVIFGFFAALVIIPFVIWGDQLMQRFTLDGVVQWLGDYGQWAWLSGIGLLISDIALPIPGTLIMSALGYVYGPWWGALLAAFGSFISGAIGYWLCRSFGQRAAISILGKKEYERGQETFDKFGGWIVILSRWLPIFPEVISCMAGLNHMSIKKFHLALLVSAIPMGIIYAQIGHAGVNHPTLALILSIFIPPAIWLVVRPIFSRKQRA